MFLAKIVGKIVSVTKNEGLHGKKILIAVPINMNDEVIGGEIISLDNVGAGIGDKVCEPEDLQGLSYASRKATAVTEPARGRRAGIDSPKRVLTLSNQGSKSVLAV